MSNSTIRFLVIFLIFSNSQLWANDSAHSQQNSKKPIAAVNVSISEIQDLIAPYKIKILDWSGVQYHYEIKNPKALNTQSKWVAWFKENLTNWGMEEGPEQIQIHLLPVGVNFTKVTAAKKYAKTTMPDLQNDYRRATPLKIESILTLPELKKLQAFAETEKEQTIQFVRMINPNRNGGIYSFLVQYNDRLQQMVPISRNGQAPEKNQMEGYTSFNSIWKFINKTPDEFSASRYKDTLFLSLKGNDSSFIAIREELGSLNILSRVKIKNGPQLTYNLFNTPQGFSTLTHIPYGEEKLVFVDSATYE